MVLAGPPQPSARFGHSAVNISIGDSTNNVILFGGKTASGPTNELWRYNPNSMTDQWQPLMPANSPPSARFYHAATNPRFFSIYNGTDVTGTISVAPGFKIDEAEATGNCAACHAPGAAANAPLTTDMNSLTGVDREGVFCEFCHKIGAVYLDAPAGRPFADAPGVLSLRLHRTFPGDALFFGTLDDVTRRVRYLPLQQKSQFCAPCHQFSFHGTPIYESFREWQESPYAAQGIECQTCHMPPGSSPTFVLPEKGGLARDPSLLASHLDSGLKDAAFMQSSVSMTVTAQRLADALVVTVTVTNSNAGHHVPTD